LPGQSLSVHFEAEVHLRRYEQQVAVCIPARWQAQRFPGKLLQPFGNGTVLSHTIGIALQADIGPVRVLADDERIEAEARTTGVEVLRVQGPWRNGSERIAAALRTGDLGEPLPELLVNLQGDAVGVPPSALAAAVEVLRANPDVALGTCAVRARPGEHGGRTTITASGGRARNFSRAALPPGEGRGDSLLLHLGLYAYRVPQLLRVAAASPGVGERREGLEQLRWLEMGFEIGLHVLPGPAAEAHAIDWPADLQSIASRRRGSPGHSN